MGDSRAALRSWLLQRIGRQPGSDDVLYEVESYAEGFQATLSLSCLDESVQFVGEVAPTSHEAEKQAALQALQTYCADRDLKPGKGHLQTIPKGKGSPKDAFKGQLVNAARNAASLAGHSKGQAIGQTIGQPISQFATKPVVPPMATLASHPMSAKGKDQGKGFSLGAGAGFGFGKGEPFKGGGRVDKGTDKGLNKGKGKGKGDKDTVPLIDESEPKGVLNFFVQRTAKRAVVKDDLVYTTDKYPEGFQTTVTLNCFEGEQFVGEVCANIKAAEKAAAKQALLAYEHVVEALMAPSRQARQQKLSNQTPMRRTLPAGAPSDEASLHALQPPAKRQRLTADEQPRGEVKLEPKSKIIQFVQRLMARPLQTGDLTWDVDQHGEDYQATLTMHCTGGIQFVGDLSNCAKSAEKAAAEQAILHFAEDIEKVDAQPSAASSSKKKKKSQASGGASRFANGGYLTMDPKSVVNTYAQKKSMRPICKGDITYSVEHYPEGYQATATLHVFEDAQFVGGLALSAKEAEKEAARQVLVAYADDLEATLADVGQASGQGQPGTDSFPPMPPALAPGHAPPTQGVSNNKTELNTVVLRISRTAHSKDNISYETVAVDDPSGHLTVCTVNALRGREDSGPDEQFAFTGDVCGDAKDAEQSAAGVALAFLMTDDRYSAAMRAPNSKDRAKAERRADAKGGKGNGKDVNYIGKGKGKHFGRSFGKAFGGKGKSVMLS